MSQERVAAISVTLPLSQVTELQRRADDEGRKVSHIMRDAVDFFLTNVPSSRRQDDEAAELAAA